MESGGLRRSRRLIKRALQTLQVPAALEVLEHPDSNRKALHKPKDAHPSELIKEMAAKVKVC